MQEELAGILVLALLFWAGLLVAAFAPSGLDKLSKAKARQTPVGDVDRWWEPPARVPSSREGIRVEQRDAADDEYEYW